MLSELGRRFFTLLAASVVFDIHCPRGQIGESEREFVKSVQDTLHLQPEEVEEIVDGSQRGQVASLGWDCARCIPLGIEIYVSSSGRV